ncbi:hypothetical protein FHETE_5 [Fusarium heterosporum]|uniref:Uncharacterized protein n=1 Tax=Fusarium heterosporum TaxID=42747 RepID=A0A8H5U3D2_FUSHE|nr:hypothetical protein FHETE_5 [Fusarium heterosporum]
MPGIILAPYNDSMRLGQGYNSFLQTPCIQGAMKYDEAPLHLQQREAKSVSQATMNISAGSTIKNGIVSVSGTTVSLNEAKFVSSDMNAVVSVKVGKAVINQTTNLLENAVFTPADHAEKLDNRRFFDIYGDTYISGFIEGGELSGVVSIKLLDMSDKTAVENAVKGQMNSATPPSQFTLSENGNLTSSNAALSKTETTITVNWSGGGQIKPVKKDEEWTFDSLLRAASGFPARVAACPQRTWAVLTPYYQTKTFVSWSEKHKITVPRFQAAQSYTSDLLDMYMLYKNNLAKIQSVLSDPTNYRLIDDVPLAVEVNTNSLLTARKQMKEEMKKIVAEVDQLCYDPELVLEIEENSKILPPEIWATRLPISSQHPKEAAAAEIHKALQDLSNFSFEPSSPTSTKKDVANGPATAPQALCTPEVEAALTTWERSMMVAPEKLARFSKFRFGMPFGRDNVKSAFRFCDVVDLTNLPPSVDWPTVVKFTFADRRTKIVPNRQLLILEKIQIWHGDTKLERAGNSKMASKILRCELQAGEYITKMRLSKSPKWDDFYGDTDKISFIEVTTSANKVYREGDIFNDFVVEFRVPEGCLGLKGFYGLTESFVQRLGPVWGTQ